MSLNGLSQDYYNVKIFDKRKRIPKSEIKTLLDFKKNVQKTSRIPIHNQKLIRNSKKIREPDQTHIQALNISEQDQLGVLTIKPQSKHIKANILDKSKPPEQEIQLPELQLNRSSQKNITQLLRQFLLKKGCRHPQPYIKLSKGDKNLALQLWKKKAIKARLGFLTANHIDRILTALFQNGCFRQYTKQIIFQDNFWQFIIAKITEENLGLKQILQQYPKKIEMIRNRILQPEDPLSQSQQLMIINRLNIFTADNQIIEQIQKKIPQTRQKIEEAVGLSQNNLDRAIEILLQGGQKYQVDMQKQFWNDQDQQLFLAQFLAKQSHVKKIKLSISTKYLDSYTISLKYRCKAIFNLAVKHRKFIQKIILKYRPELKGLNRIEA